MVFVGHGSYPAFGFKRKRKEEITRTVRSLILPYGPCREEACLEGYDVLLFGSEPVSKARHELGIKQLYMTLIGLDMHRPSRGLLGLQ